MKFKQTETDNCLAGFSTSGSAAAQCGEALPHRNHLILSGERLRLEPSGGGVASKTGRAFHGEAEPHRTVRRRSRENLMAQCLVSLAAAFLFVAICQVATAQEPAPATPAPANQAITTKPDDRYRIG